LRKAGLTDTAIRQLTAPEGKRRRYSDWPASPLELVVSGPPSSHKSWTSRPRLTSGQQKITFGPYPQVPLARARELARAVEAARAAGADLETLRAIARGADPTKPVVAVKAVDTVERVIAQFNVRYLEQRNRAPGYIAGTNGIFQNHVLPAWRGRDITTITRREIIERLDVVTDKAGPVAANRTLAALSKLFRWAQQRGLIETLPVAGIEKPAEEATRDRVLGDAELRLVWQAAVTAGYPFGTFFKLLILLGQRRGETAVIQWRDVDLDGGLLTLPAEITKNRTLHLVPLAPAVIELFAAMPRIGPHVLSTNAAAPIAGFSKAKGQIDRLAAAAATAAGLAPPEPWTPHDLRRSCATGMARLGVPRFDIARVLNHTDASVTGGYDRYEYLAEKRAALSKWANHVVGLTRPQIISMREVAHAG
jgi:integrase